MNISIQATSDSLKLSVLAAVLLLTPISVSAQSICGNIVTFEPPSSGVPEVTPISDCDNPFNKDNSEPFTYSFTLNGQPIAEGSILNLENTRNVPGSFTINSADRNFAFTPLTIFKASSTDWYQIEAFGNENFIINSLDPGVYTAVLIYEEPPILSQDANLLQNLADWLFPSAMAFYPDFVEVVTIEFTVSLDEPLPEGASSVLFLPGVKASRLYLTENGTENQLWETLSDDDIELLRMTDLGDSVNNVYTRDVIGNAFGITSIYSDFISEMESLESQEIVSFETFAYDWRSSIFDVATQEVQYENELRRLLDEVLTLASSSYTGKVTLVGHSNGGLVAKSLLNEYGESDLKDKVDKLIMIGTPQLGTPAAIGSALHGLDESIIPGLFPSQSIMRDIARNTPALYTLLPSQKYFDEVGIEVITTDGGDKSAFLRQYGLINNASNLNALLVNSLENRDEPQNISELGILNSGLLNSGSAYKNQLDNWTAPQNLQVYELAGVGRPTLESINYREFGCLNVFSPSCEDFTQLKPEAVQTNQGDGTVTLTSALGYQGEKNSYVFDLLAISDTISSNDHKDLMENQLFQDLIKEIVLFPYINAEINQPTTTQRLTDFTIVSGHSPITLLAKDSGGNRAGVLNGEVLTEIENSDYYEFGGSKYLVFPSNIDIDIEVDGTREGLYSLSVKELRANGSEVTKSFLDSATTTPDMKATFSIVEGVFSTLKTDYDGDGETDIEQTLDGDEIVDDVIYSYADLRTSINGLNLSNRNIYWLQKKINLSEKFAKKKKERVIFSRIERRLLTSLERTLVRYERRDRITVVELEELQTIINYLKNDQ